MSTDWFLGEIGPKNIEKIQPEYWYLKKIQFCQKSSKNFPGIVVFRVFHSISLSFEHSMLFKYKLDEISDFLVPIRLLNSLNWVSERQIKTEAPFWF